MGNLRDITNMVFGDWKVVKFDESKEKYKYYWICRCIKCGTVKSIISSSLLNGKSLKCHVCNNTYGKYIDIKGYKDDLVGRKFGRLTVISYSHKEHSHSHWNCVCECGEERIYSISFLNKGKYKMCSKCSKALKDSLKEPVIKDEKEWTPSRKKYNKYEFVDNYVVINEKVLIDRDKLELVDSVNKYVPINSGGYPLMWVNDKEKFLHRFIMGLPDRYDSKTQLIVDHISGDKFDNRVSNLRIVTKDINPINCKKYSNNTSGTKGVSWNKRLNKWQVNLQINGDSKYLGVYSNKEDAIRIRKEAEIKYYGEYNRSEINECICELS